MVPKHPLHSTTRANHEIQMFFCWILNYLNSFQALSSAAANKLSMGAAGNLAFVPYTDEL